MTMKDAAANSLLMFVAATCVVLIVKAIGPAGKDAVDDAAPPMRDGVRVYYFHSNTRCPTCRTIEAYAEEAVQSGFADALKTDKLQWRIVNYQTPGNEHFAVDYGFASASVVLVRFQDGRQVAWKTLPEVWDLTGDKARFIAFVQTSVGEYLRGTEATTPKKQDAPPVPGSAAQDDSLPIPE